MTISSLHYHGLTSYRRNQIPPHYLDWENQPLTFKSYRGIEAIQLPKVDLLGQEKLSDFFKKSFLRKNRQISDIADLSKILFMTYTITGKRSHGGSYNYFRSVPSAGALYPTEIYAATHDIKGVRNGLYHFSVNKYSLVPLRNEDVSMSVANALCDIPRRYPSLVFFFTVIFFRSSWKYRERAYRYNLLDTGHMICNMEFALKLQGLSFNLLFDFEDNKINQLLGLDSSREVTLAVCYIEGPQFFMHKDKGKQSKELGDKIKKTSKVSNKEIRYSVIEDIHRAGDIRHPATHVNNISKFTSKPCLKKIEIEEPHSWTEIINFKESLLCRRSRRNFISEPLSESCLSCLLKSSHLKDLELVSTSGEITPFLNVGLIIGNVKGLEPGIYFRDDVNYSLQMIIKGSFTELMARICLDQMWIAKAAVLFLFIGNLADTDQFYGPRGYRYLMLNSGRLGERLYLAATAMGLGCCGIGAFYDYEAAQLLDLTEGWRLLYLVALGPLNSI
jgi:SagB-type dehydrogenase family enzyme